MQFCDDKCLRKIHCNTQWLLGAQWFYTKMYSNTWSITLAAFESFLAETPEELSAFCNEIEADLNLFGLFYKQLTLHFVHNQDPLIMS